jgi:ribosome-associated protein
VAHRLPPFVEVTSRVRIPAGELDLSFAASGGPGGQNVNKVASKAVLRWNPARSAALTGPDRDLALTRLASRLTNDGDLVIASDRHRDQPKNVADALARLADVVRGALYRPRPRKASRPTRASRERRLSSKRQRSDLKRGRRAGYD